MRDGRDDSRSAAHQSVVSLLPSRRTPRAVSTCVSSPRPATGSAKVLFLSALQIFPTRSGGQLRSFALANALQHHGIDVFVYSMVGRKSEYLSAEPSSIQTWPEGTEEYVDRRLLWFLAQYGSYGLGLPPLWIPAYLRAAAATPRELLLPALLREKLAWCDVVLADFPFLHPIFEAPSARGRLRVLSTHNVEHHMLNDRSRWQDRWARGAVRRMELGAAQACDVLVTCCQSDQEFFERHARIRRSILVPNGIDVRRFRGMEGHRDATRRALGIADNVRVLLFTAPTGRRSTICWHSPAATPNCWRNRALTSWSSAALWRNRFGSPVSPPPAGWRSWSPTSRPLTWRSTPPTAGPAPA